MEMLKSAEKLTCGELRSNCLQWLVWLLIVLLLLFPIKSCYSGKGLHCCMRIRPFLLNGHRQEAAESCSGRLEDRLQKAANRLRERGITTGLKGSETPRRAEIWEVML